MKSVKTLLIYGVAFFLIIQMIPYGRNHKMLPLVNEPKWDSPVSREIVKRACFNCHSHETVWPWYSLVAPASWLVYSDVTEARSVLNFSDWKGGNGPAENPGFIELKVMSGKMPPFQYVIAHPEARLKDDERKRLVEGIKATCNLH